MKIIRLLIDDIRTFEMIGFAPFDAQNDGQRVIARTPYEGINALQRVDVTHLYIDHDLGPDPDGTEFPNGYKVICWAIEQDILPPYVEIVSSNPVGRANIQAALRHEGYVRAQGGWIHWDKALGPQSVY